MNRRWLVAAAVLVVHSAQADMVCRVTTGGGLAFGSYEVSSGTPRDSVMNLTVTCDRNGGPANVTLTVRLGQGNHGSSTTNRRMQRAALPVDYLSYGLYRDVNRSSAWGSSDGVDTMSRTLTVPNKESRSTTFVIYGRIPAQQDVAAGTYSDSVLVTILY